MLKITLACLTMVYVFTVYSGCTKPAFTSNSKELPSLAITSPNGGSSYSINTTPQNISGTCSTDVTSLTSSMGTFIDNNCSDGTWSLSTNTLSTESNTVTITGINSVGNNITRSISITYDTMAPNLAITSPNGGSSYSINVTPQTISGTCDTDVKLLASSTGSFSDSDCSDGTWTLTIGSLTVGSKTVYITGTDAAGNKKIKTITITLDTTAPSLAITFPNSGNALTTHRTSTTVYGTCSTDAINLSTNSGTFDDQNCTDGTWSLNFSSLAVGENLVTITAYDVATNSIAKTISITIPSPVTDPLYQHAWHLNNTGQLNFSTWNIGTSYTDLNLQTSYATNYLGSNVRVAISDTGVEIAHEDLSENIFPGSRNYVTGSGANNYLGDPTLPNTDANIGCHGTSVAGLIGAVKGNGLGSHGVAPNTYLLGFNFLKSTQSTALMANQNTADVEIINQSWGYGPPANQCDPASKPSIDSTVFNTMKDGFFGNLTSNGKSIIYVKSSGNFYSTTYDIPTKCGVNLDSSFDPINTVPFIINVAALTSVGKKATYSSVGSTNWISGFGGEYGYVGVSCNGDGGLCSTPAIMTTDQSGCTKGYVGENMFIALGNAWPAHFNLFQKGNLASAHAENLNCNYTSTFNGTSSAAPTVSGSIALILQANRNLTARDVKHILASTAVQTDPTSPSWITNAANYKFSNHYGFGRIDADAAVNMAKTYTSQFPHSNFITKTYSKTESPALVIPDNNPAGISTQYTVPDTLTVENVRILLNATHTFTGDLGVKLTSPSGTTSVLLASKSHLNGYQNFANFAVLSNAFYGETGVGTWTLTIFDEGPLDTGTLNSWTLELYGH